MCNDGASAGDTRTNKLPIPKKPGTPTVETGQKMTLEVAPPHYWAVRDQDPWFWRCKKWMVWAIDPVTKKPVSEAPRVDLKRGDTDATMPFDWISDLQRDMWDFGYRAVLADRSTGVLPATPKPDGKFDDRCERVVRRFQIHARLGLRKQGNKTVTVKPTYSGEVTGVIDDATKREIELWKLSGNTRALQPFDPEGILGSQVSKRLFCPALYELLSVPYFNLCDREDLEPYGPVETSMDPDGWRHHHNALNKKTGKYGPAYTWHLVGLACDMNFYSTKIESKPWYYPKTGKDGAGEYDQWPPWETRRIWAVARQAGLAIAEPTKKDPRHVEYHPLMPSSSGVNVWTSVPDSIRKFISPTGGNTPVNIRKAWGLAVDPMLDPQVGDFPAPPTDVAIV